MDKIITHPYLTKGYLDYDHLLGHPFNHGVRDCFYMLRQTFADNTPIRIANYAHPDDWWLQEDQDLYNKYAVQEGFQYVDINNVSELVS